jgi:hypothetical protein
MSLISVAWHARRALEALLPYFIEGLVDTVNDSKPGVGSKLTAVSC